MDDDNVTPGGCTDRVYRDLGLAGKDAPKTGGDDRMLWMDILRRFDPEILAAGGWSSSAAYVQPEQSLGEAAYLLTASRPVAGGINGLIEHENAYFAAVPFPTAQNPPSPEDRIKIWDSLSYHLDGQTPRAIFRQIPRKLLDFLAACSVFRTNMES